MIVCFSKALFQTQMHRVLPAGTRTGLHKHTSEYTKQPPTRNVPARAGGRASMKVSDGGCAPLTRLMVPSSFDERDLERDTEFSCELDPSAATGNRCRLLPSSTLVER